ncbi:c-type cytochrome [Synechococcus sp. HJ21-Hayes]|nr:c-type cytochrome [Synechococcus sp. JJ3a-Johnson]MCP9853574.1 c-type cytochrome [Synechococcus sp. HJ21-Hayes]
MGLVQPVGVAQFSHGPGGQCDHRATTVTAEPTPTPTDGPKRGLISALVLLATACVVLVLAFALPAARSDPYTRSTLQLGGSMERGEQLFLINCAGCHGMAAQGLVGPNLHGVAERKNNRQLIQQVVSGRTPPMPRFQPEPQAMADLLSYLHQLS